MKEIHIENKEKYLTENWPFKEAIEVSDRKRCIHCDSVIVVGNFKVFADDSGDEYICCPNAPDCDGTIIDWIDV